MLHTPTLFDALQGFGASQPPIPDKITGRLLAYNRLPIEARTAIALRLVRGTAPVTDLTVAQACRLARVPRARVDRQLGRHRNVGDALVRAFGRLSDQQQITVVRSLGIERVWSLLSQAL